MRQITKCLFLFLALTHAMPLMPGKQLDIKKIRKELQKLSPTQRRKRLAELREQARQERKNPVSKKATPKRISKKQLSRQQEREALRAEKAREVARIATLSPEEQQQIRVEKMRKRRLARAQARRKQQEQARKALLIIGGIMAAGATVGAVTLGVTGLSDVLRRRRWDITEQVKDHLQEKIMDPAIFKRALMQTGAQWRSNYNPDYGPGYRYNNRHGNNTVLDYLITRYWPTDTLSYQGANVDLVRLKEDLGDFVEGSDELRAILDPFVQDTRPNNYPYPRARTSQRDERTTSLRIGHSLGAPSDKPHAEFTAQQEERQQLAANPSLRAQARAAYDKVVADAARPTDSRSISEQDREEALATHDRLSAEANRKYSRVMAAAGRSAQNTEELRRLSALHQRATRRPLPRYVTGLIASFLTPEGQRTRGIEALHRENRPDTTRANARLAELDEWLNRERNLRERTRNRAANTIQQATRAHLTNRNENARTIQQAIRKRNERRQTQIENAENITGLTLAGMLAQISDHSTDAEGEDGQGGTLLD